MLAARVFPQLFDKNSSLLGILELITTCFRTGYPRAEARSPPAQRPNTSYPDNSKLQDGLRYSSPRYEPLAPNPYPQPSLGSLGSAIGLPPTAEPSSSSLAVSSSPSSSTTQRPTNPTANSAKSQWMSWLSIRKEEAQRTCP